MSAAANSAAMRALGWISKFILACGIVMTVPHPLAVALKFVFTAAPGTRFHASALLANLVAVSQVTLLIGSALIAPLCALWVYRTTGDRESQLLVLKGGALRSLPAFSLVVACFFFMGAVSVVWGPTIFGAALVLYASYLLASDRSAA